MWPAHVACSNLCFLLVGGIGVLTVQVLHFCCIRAEWECSSTPAYVAQNSNQNPEARLRECSLHHHVGARIDDDVVKTGAGFMFTVCQVGKRQAVACCIASTITYLTRTVHVS